jgi:hypothetical protein
VFRLAPLAFVAANRLRNERLVRRPSAPAALRSGFSRAIVDDRARFERSPRTELIDGVSTVRVNRPDAPSSDGPGPYTFERATYRFGRGLNDDIYDQAETELHAEVTMPTGRGDGASLPGKFPVLFFLHGNHAKCGDVGGSAADDAGDRGVCPRGVGVVESFEGMRYLAEQLASWGFAVVNIDANRGIQGGNGDAGDPGLIDARAKLILSHVAAMNEFNEDGGGERFPLDVKSKLDLGSIGFLGHSRGGDAVRSAYGFLQAGGAWTRALPNVDVKAICELAPTDFDEDAPNPINVPWAVVLPGLDGDVYTLEGRRPFERMARRLDETRPAPKSTIWASGMNHNFMNTRWTVSDAYPPYPEGQPPLWNEGDEGSPREQGVAKWVATTLFRSRMGPEQDAKLARAFDPAYKVPAAVAQLTRLDRGFFPAVDGKAAQPLKRFRAPAGFDAPPPPEGVRTRGPVRVEEVPYDAERGALQMVWRASTTPTASPSVEMTFDAPRTDWTEQSYIDFDLAKPPDLSTWSDAKADARLELVLSDGKLAKAMRLADLAEIYGPFVPHVMSTVRMPLGELGIAPGTGIAGIKLTFGREAGALELCDPRFCP